MPKDFVLTVPEMDEVTPEKEKLIAQFLERQAAFYGEDRPHFLARAAGDERVLAYKFLTARKWSVEEAEKMFRGVIQMRAERKLDRQPLFPSAFPTRGFDPADVNKVMELPDREENIYDRYYRTVNPAYACNFHKWDKQGHPILIERTGQCNVRETFARFKALANVGQKPTQPAVDFQLLLNEVGGTLVRYQDKRIREKEGRRILGIVMIMDVKGLGYGHLWRPCLELLKATFSVDSTYYPEGLHRLFIVNCPPMMSFAFNVVKGWIDPRVHDKIVFVTPNEAAETLLKVIDAENLPSFLGGTCECDGGCVPQAPLESSPTTGGGGGGDGDTFTEEITVPAGKSFTKNFELVAGEEVVWEFAADDNKDISFTVSWFDEASDGERVVVDTTRLKEGASTYVASSKGKLILTWDNAAAWFTAKKLQMRVFKMAPQTE